MARRLAARHLEDAVAFSDAIRRVAGASRRRSAATFLSSAAQSICIQVGCLRSPLMPRICLHNSSALAH